MAQPRAIVLSGVGINCERESAFALVSAGFLVDTVLITRIHSLRDYQMLLLPGGFSYGDSTGSGNILSHSLAHYLKEEIADFIKSGNFVVGICNGCQALARFGLLDASDRNFALDINESGQYECRWIYARAAKNSTFFNEGEVFYMPVAHKEGRFVSNNTNDSNPSNIALQYCNKEGVLADGEYPFNPNGSVCDIAALSNRSGNVLGVMPHPDRAILYSQTPQWVKSNIDPDARTPCHQIFQRAYDAVIKSC